MAGRYLPTWLKNHLDFPFANRLVFRGSLEPSKTDHLGLDIDLSKDRLKRH